MMILGENKRVNVNRMTMLLYKLGVTTQAHRVKLAERMSSNLDRYVKELLSKGFVRKEDMTRSN